MNPRKAILDAANQIERHPQTFDFGRGGLPDRDGRGGGDRGLGCCALAWIGYYADHQRPANIRRVSPFKLGYWEAILILHPDLSSMPRSYEDRVSFGMLERRFYTQMTDCMGNSDAWSENAYLCATALRQYADLYFPEPIQPRMLPVLREEQELLAA